MNRNTGIAVILCGFVIILLAFMVFNFFRSQDYSEAPAMVFGSGGKEVVLFLEALSRIQEEGLFLEPSTPTPKIIQDTLKSYLVQKDPFSDYLSRDEFLRFKQLQDEHYVGIGMEIEKDRHGQIVCFPYPGSPAEREGIRAGDYLQRIEGIPVSGKSVFTVASMARGPMGTKIKVVVRSKSGAEKELAVTCEQLEIKHIQTRRLQDFAVVEIHAFTPSTTQKLVNIFSSWEKSAPVIIDLRGNSGGDLDAAIDSTELFLEKGQKIVIIESRTGSTSYKSMSAALVLAYPIYLWQDATTASAAEVFIAALTDNQQGVSIGKTTFGKGTKQDIIELSDGSALFLTTGLLKTPNGLGIQGRGLNPDYQLSNDSVDTADYLSKVKELTRAIPQNTAK